MCSFDAFIKVNCLVSVSQIHLLSCQALVDHQIAARKIKVGGNKVKAEAIVMTTKTDDRNVVKTFKYLYKILLSKGINFDPLQMFSRVDADNEDLDKEIVP